MLFDILLEQLPPLLIENIVFVKKNYILFSINELLRKLCQ